MKWIPGAIFGVALFFWGRRYQDRNLPKGPAMPEGEPKDGGISIYCDHETGEIVIEIEEDEGDEVIVFTLEDPETGYAVARAISMAAMRIEAKRAGQTGS